MTTVTAQVATGPGHGPGEQQGEHTVGTNDVPAVEQDDVGYTEHDRPGSAPANQSARPRRGPAGAGAAPTHLHEAVPEEEPEQRRGPPADKGRQQPLDGGVDRVAADRCGERDAPRVQHPGVGESDE